MSDKNLIGYDDWPSYEPYSTLQEAIAGAARFIPAHHPEFLLLFEQTQKLALDCGYEWDIPETAPLAMAILNAIMEYGEKADGPGLKPKELEAWLNKSKRLARELRQILRSQEGQDRFAHIISQGYLSDELVNPLGPTPEKNVLLNLLEHGNTTRNRVYYDTSVTAFEVTGDGKDGATRKRVVSHPTGSIAAATNATITVPFITPFAVPPNWDVWSVETANTSTDLRMPKTVARTASVIQLQVRNDAAVAVEGFLSVEAAYVS